MPSNAVYIPLLHSNIWDNFLNLYISYELNVINSVIWSTCIHTFHITDICPWKKYACGIPHICATALLSVIFSAHIHQKSISCNICLPYYYTIGANNGYVPKIWHMPKLLDMHLWEKYVNIQATYEVAPIYDVARVAVHRW